MHPGHVPESAEIRRATTARSRQVGYPEDDYAGEEIVQDALHDTMTGIVRWQPAKKTLEQHLLDVIHLRTKRLRMHAAKHPRSSLSSDIRGEAAATESEIDAMVLEQSPRHATVVYASAVMAELRQLANEDPLVLRMLDAFQEGAVSRSDVISVGRFALMDYHNARRRLDRLIAQLADHPGFGVGRANKENDDGAD